MKLQGTVTEAEIKPDGYVVMKKPPHTAPVHVKLTAEHPGSQSSGNFRLKSSLKSSDYEENEEPSLQTRITMGNGPGPIVYNKTNPMIITVPLPDPSNLSEVPTVAEYLTTTNKKRTKSFQSQALINRPKTAFFNVQGYKDSES